ncbi:MAG: cysteine hydrolase family protein [Candidatus Krumholzibacteriia bacterium]
MHPTRPTILILVAALLAAATVCAAGEDVPTALVIIDIQEFYFPGGALPLVAPEAASANAGRLLARFRTAGLPVFHVGHAAAAGRGFHTDVQPAAAEPVLIKSEVNAFLDTDLRQRLQQGGIRRVVLCGMQTHMCLEGAVRAAHDYGFEVVVVADACATRDLEHGGAVVPAAQVHAATLATLDRVYARVIDTETALAEF